MSDIHSRNFNWFELKIGMYGLLIIASPLLRVVCSKAHTHLFIPISEIDIELRELCKSKLKILDSKVTNVSQRVKHLDTELVEIIENCKSMKSEVKKRTEEQVPYFWKLAFFLLHTQHRNMELKFAYYKTAFRRTKLFIQHPLKTYWNMVWEIVGIRMLIEINFWLFSWQI